jgi:hypothetical protein
MAYELFGNKAVKFGTPQLTIREGRIVFNAATGDILSRAGAKFAHLLWDGDACKLAIRPVAKEDATTFRVTIRNGKRGGTISAQSLLNYIQWHAETPIVVAAQWNKNEGLLEARLPKHHVGVVGRNRGS